MKILIVDDSRVFHSYMGNLLAKELSNLQIFFSFSGEEGLKIYEEEAPDIILLDIFMPGIQGLEVLEEIRRNDPYVQIIIISRSDEEDVLEQAFYLGANDYIVKKPRPRELITRIRRAINTQEEVLARKKAQEDLLREKKILEDVTYHANCGLFLLDRKRKIIYANSIAREWFSSFKELIGLSCCQILDKKQKDCIISQVFELDEALRGELVNENGHIFYAIASPIRDESGEIGQVSLVLVDITKRKGMEMSLAKAVENIRSVNEAFLSFGPDHEENIRKVVKKAKFLSGADYVFYNEIIGQRLYIREAWDPPQNLKREDNAQGHICYEVVKKGGVEPYIIKDLQSTSFARTDAGVQALGLTTYVGCPVKVRGRVQGVLCTIYKERQELPDSLLESLLTLARGLGVEVERKMTMESLHRFRSALDSSADAIFLIDYDSMHFLDVNQEACNSLGYSREELLTMGPHHIKPEYDEGSLQETFTHLLTNPKKDGTILTFHQRKDGSLFPVEVFIRSYKTKEQILLIASVRDITERKEMEEKLRESEERYRLLVENQIDCVCLWKPDTTLLYVNDGYCQVFKKRREDLLGEKWIQLIPEDSQEIIKKNIQSLVRKGERMKAAHPVILGDGSEGWFEWIDTPLMDERGKIVKIQSVGRDITERKRAEKEIQRRIEFETLITSLATFFINLPAARMDEGLLEGLKEICQFTSFESAIIYMLSEDRKSATISHQWPKKEIYKEKEIFIQEDIPVLFQRLTRLETISIPSVFLLPEKMVQERSFFEREGWRSLVMVPLSSGENLLGYLQFALYSENQVLCDETISLIKISSTMFVNALERKKAELNLKEELEKARQLKASLFPTIHPSIKNLKVSGILRQASHVGGDYYNYYQIGEELLFLMVDVTGHGLDAALITIFVSTFFRRELEDWEEAPDPLYVLDLLNQDFQQQGFPDDYFLEVFLGVLSPTMEVRYAVAGAIRSLIFHPVHEPKELPSMGGSIIHNLAHSPQFGSGRFFLEKGEALLIYTDGVDEILLAQDLIKGKELMYQKVRKFYRLLSPEDLLEKTVDEAQKLLKREQPPDDMSILGFFHDPSLNEREYLCEDNQESLLKILDSLSVHLEGIVFNLEVVRRTLYKALKNIFLFSQEKLVRIKIIFDASRLILRLEKKEEDLREFFYQGEETPRPLLEVDSFAFNSKGNRLYLGWFLVKNQPL